MDNNEYAELLEKVAARLKELEEPISQKTISAIGEVARDVIKEGKKESKSILLPDSAFGDIKGAKKAKAKKPTPEYQQIIDEADAEIKEGHRKQARAIVDSQNYVTYMSEQDAMLILEEIERDKR